MLINGNTLVIITVPKTIHFYLPEDFDNNFKHEIDFIIKQNKLLVDHTLKNKISRLLLKHKHRNNIHEREKMHNEGTTQICS